MERKQPTHSEDLIDGASSSSTSPHVGDYEGGTEKQKGNNYEVFLNFRGEDTRKGFTDHLYTRLTESGIHVFRDDNELRVGEEIGEELLRSIAQSKISIPIISENYAFSKWCLCELAQILKCRSKGQLVLPIFYKVEPSQVRHHTVRLGDAVDAQKWEDALKEVSLLKGWEVEKLNDGHEAELVKMVVRRVMSELKRLFQLNVPKQLVGTNDHVKHIMSKIDANFNSTWIIGIYGMGGIGKTTLAKVLYNKLLSNFENHSFLENIRETSQRRGIECLQKQLIYDIVGSSQKVFNVDYGIRVLRSQCTSKKVLALLDDIDDNTHLDALVGDGSWFRAGSVVIVTTRNKSILDNNRFGHLHELNELSSSESLILFSRHAFRDDFPPSDYEDISKDVVSITGGLPLALEVIGSFLCGKTKEAWRDTSKKLKKIPDKKVQDRLRISYEALDSDDQQIFLDIACFFIGSSKQYPTYMWDACDFYPGKGIEVLSLMSLIKIDERGRLRMHDQLRDLGREIVRLENEKKLEKRSRLWNYEEANDVLENNKGNSKIEALRLENHGREGHGKKSYRGEQFNRLTNLRFLHVDDTQGISLVNGANFIGDSQNLLPKLRWLKWTNCPSDFVANFHMKKLVFLDISNSSISEDWRGWGPLKMATKLKVLNLSSCRNLKRTPDLSAFKELEILDFKDCTNLEEIHPSIGKLVSLTELQLWHTRITKLPESIGNLQNLRNFSIRWWTHGITTLPESIGNLRNLTTLNIGQILIGDLRTGITTLPESIGNLQSLTTLDIGNTPVTELPSAVGMLANLQVLNASRCENLEGLPSSIGELVSLKELLLDFSGIRGLPESISKLSSLQHLDVADCRNLREIQELPSSLTALHITFPTPSLPFLSELTLLQELTLSDLRPLERLRVLPVRLSKVRLVSDGSMTYVEKEMELRYSELIRDKSSGLRKATTRWSHPCVIEFDIEQAFSSK